MKKILTAVAMVLAIQGSATADTLTFSSGLSNYHIEKAMLRASAMCKRDSSVPNPVLKNPVNDIRDSIPPELRGDRPKVNDFVVLMSYVYVGCMLTHIK